MNNTEPFVTVNGGPFHGMQITVYRHAEALAQAERLTFRNGENYTARAITVHGKTWYMVHAVSRSATVESFDLHALFPLDRGASQ